MPGNAVVYLRVSTDEQAEKGLSLRAQEEAATEFAGRKGWPVAAVIRDEGVSGGKPLKKRPGLRQAIAALGPGDSLVVSKRDRIFRTDAWTGASIEREVTSRGARIVSAAGEGTEDDSPINVLMRRILDAFAEFELSKIRERTDGVLASKRSNGERCGQVPYGFRTTDDGVGLVVDPDEAAVVELTRSLRDDGLSLRAIAAELLAMGLKPKNGGEAWGVTTIRRLLSRSEPCPET
ncbi:recombinase family protein [Paludisphaera rhizosphaerae]|uniref:recombinase family protein n=1 Tax=Paludisphaera rhizosphaerae TaxID=2711216 RepID=UPI0013ED341A|nr:recombinase family protein [Paludisphaera rhizosphaerae]